MTFQPIHRDPPQKVKRMPVPSGGIVLHWWANPTAPFLGIHLGESLARAIGLCQFSHAVQMLIGSGEHAGKAAISNADRGSWTCRVRGGTWCVFLDSNASFEHFAIAERTVIESASIQVSGKTVEFQIPAAFRLKAAR